MKFHENSAVFLSFSRKSASRRSGELRRSAEKLLEFRIPQHPDDPDIVGPPDVPTKMQETWWICNVNQSMTPRSSMISLRKGHF